jgi:hypothetical protein
VSNAIWQDSVARKNTVTNRDKFQIWMALNTIATALADDAIARDADF